MRNLRLNIVFVAAVLLSPLAAALASPAGEVEVVPVEAGLRRGDWTPGCFSVVVARACTCAGVCFMTGLDRLLP